MRDFQFQNHDRDDDSDDAVAERKKPVFLHAVDSRIAGR
jgi:hypothetical protein